MKTIFTVEGPRDVPVYAGKGGRTITDENVQSFWGDNDDLGGRKGCYIFGIRAGKGWTPGYVGKATKSFKQEVFAHHKLTRYQQFLADYKRGTPVMFFVLLRVKRGKVNNTHINDLESFLIQTGLAANADLMNIRGTKEAEWAISGVLRGGSGKPTRAARNFRQFMKLGAP